MFNQKFFLADVGYDSLRESETTNPLQRFQKFWGAIHALLSQFEADPTLASVKISAVALVDFEKIPFSVWIRHHVKTLTVSTAGHSKSMDDFVDLLPYQEMGNGVYELRKESPEVQEFLALLANPLCGTDLELEYRAVVAKISFRMDQAFEHCSIQHSVGVQKFE